MFTEQVNPTPPSWLWRTPLTYQINIALQSADGWKIPSEDAIEYVVKRLGAVAPALLSEVAWCVRYGRVLVIRLADPATWPAGTRLSRDELALWGRRLNTSIMAAHVLPGGTPAGAVFFADPADPAHFIAY